MDEHFQVERLLINQCIQLLEYPIPPRPRPSSSSQKPTPGDISGTERTIIDLLVSKRPEKYEKNEKKSNKIKQKEKQEEEKKKTSLLGF